MGRYVLLDINIFAIIILVFILKNYQSTFKYGNTSERIFSYLILSNIIILLSDVIAIPLWEIPGKSVHVILYITQLVFFSSAILLTMFWLYYCLFRIIKSPKLSFFLKYILPLPSILFILFIFITINQGYLFYITPENIYVRGPLFHISTIIGYIYILSSLLIVIIKRKRLERRELIPYLLLPITPIILGLVQAYFYLPVTISWPSTAIVLFGIQLHVLDNKTTTDHLTGLNNRLSLDTYLKRVISDAKQKEESMGIIMLDIDNFKSINDMYGHPEGDRALKSAANILRHSLHGKNFVARYGGDEFIIVLTDCTKKILDETILTILSEVDRFNKISSKPYKVDFSIGESVFNPSQITDIHAMLLKVDKFMYQDKHRKKLNPVSLNSDIF